MNVRRAAACSLLVSSTVGCPREVPPRPAPVVDVPMSAVTSAPDPVGAASSAPTADAPTVSAPPATPTAGCPSELPPVEMVSDNIVATGMTGLSEIVASSKSGLDGGVPAPSKGYVNFRYEVRVLAWYAGKGPERIVLTQGAEAPNEPRPPGELLFFSACPAKGGGYEPDVGYFFPAAAACRADLEALAMDATERAKTAARRAPKKKLSACKP